MLTEAPVLPQPRRAIGRRVPLPVRVLDLDELGKPEFAVVVTGMPATQGSKRVDGVFRKRTKEGRTVTVPRLVDSSDDNDGALTAWRSAVTAAAVSVLPAGWELLDGPLVADMIVTLRRPVSEPKTLRTLPHRKPDVSKLARAIEDALATDAAKLRRGVIADDARIVAYRRLCKVYQRDPYDTDALPYPGAVIRLWRYPEHLLGRMVARA